MLIEGFSLLSREILSFFTSFAISMACFPFFINYIKSKQFGQTVGDRGPESHKVKNGTPTMGGLLIITSSLISCLLYGDLTSVPLVSLLALLLSFGSVGFLDDRSKILQQSSAGLSAKIRILLESLICIIVFWALHDSGLYSFSGNVFIPYLNIWLTLGLTLHVLLAYFCVLASANAVNLTDGLDGLVTIPLVVVYSGFIFILTIFIHQFRFFGTTDLLLLSEIGVFCTAVIGSLLAFLWYNCHPAKIFMGDTASLPLGACAGLTAVLLNMELIFFVMALLFVIEILSVTIQVIYYKKTKKRIFRMAPIHHHFELKGMPETTVVTRAWVISALFTVIALVTLYI